MNENLKNNAAPCGSWQSQLSAELLTSSGSVLSEPAYCLPTNSVEAEAETAGQRRLLWLASLPEEGGRVVLRMRGNDITTVLPAPFSVRSRVNEYGGGAWCPAPDHAFFINDTDQDLYAVEIPQQSEDSKHAPSVTRVTDLPGVRFADVQWDRHRKRLICVAEFVLPDGTATSALIAVKASLGTECRSILQGS